MEWMEEYHLENHFKKRIELLQAHRSHLPELIERLKNEVSPSFKGNRNFIKKYKDNIFIISNGFKDFIVPIVKEYDIKQENIYANEFEYDAAGNIVSFNKSNVLSENNGKPRQIEKLKLDGEILVLGDGFADLEIKKEGLANKFYAFTENIKRDKVAKEADHIAPNLDEVLHDNKLEGRYSYPKNRIKVLVLENIHQDAVEKLEKEGYEVKVHPASMSEDELIKVISEVSIICIRSKTQVNKKVLEYGKKLRAIGAFCIGTNQIDLDESLKRGIAVFNAPFSNTRSVVELAISQIILLMRNLLDKMTDMHQGKWKKSADGSFEIRGKTLGIVGYGKIGSQLSVLAESVGLKVQYFDIEDKLALGNATHCETLDDLLITSDIISLHIDGRPENEELIGENEFKIMKNGVVFINLSRGHIVNIDSLVANIKSGKVHGASIDVFPEEPLSNSHPFKSPLIGMKNTILTPHIGGSTMEAQENIADFVPNKIISYINTGSTTNSVNFPNITLPKFHQAHRFIHIHKNEPGILAEINQILAKNGINIEEQFLKTNETIGYVITDINKEYDKQVIKELKKISGTIKFRVLY